MAVKKYKPYTPSRRHMSTNGFAEITRSTPEKSLLRPKKKTGGRNNTGRITMFTKSGGHKRRFRSIDFRRADKAGVDARVFSIEYDPNRSSRIALLHYADGEKRYILAPLGVRPGDTIQTGEQAEIAPGNALPIGKIPTGALVHNIELKLGKGGQLCRSAGAQAQIMAQEGDYALLRLPSGEMRKVFRRCWATVGQVGNLEHVNIKIGKAGRSRWLGIKPNVRGVAMNPVDHPHGGGEGRGKGNHPQSPWGKPTKGYRTRPKKKYSDRYIVRRRDKR